MELLLELLLVGARLLLGGVAADGVLGVAAAPAADIACSAPAVMSFRAVVALSTVL